ncbi:M23 family metallopeptidase, partial [Dactylosporangium roseum]
MSASRFFRRLTVACVAVSSGLFTAAVVAGPAAAAPSAPPPAGVDTHAGAAPKAAEMVAAAVGPRPLFQLPFACGARIQLGTYNGHGDYEIDMSASTGTHLLASAGGIAYQGHSTTGGNQVSIMHDNGWRTLYLHLQDNSYQFTDGQRVEQGQYLARTGNTGTATSGPHLHYEQQNLINGSWRAVHAWINGVPTDITDDARANSYMETSRNCPGQVGPDAAGPSTLVDGSGSVHTFAR